MENVSMNCRTPLDSLAVAVALPLEDQLNTHADGSLSDVIHEALYYELKMKIVYTR